MTSKTFTLGDSESDSGYTAKILIFVCCLLGVVVVIVVSFYAYKANFGGGNYCVAPTLDENGLSNWTKGSESIAYACFPGFFLEGHTNILMATCINDTWNPEPPACNFLPLRMDCEIDEQGLIGNVSMWQKSEADPTFIYGLIDYEEVDRSTGFLMNNVLLSKSKCMISKEVIDTAEMYPEPSSEEEILKIEFNSTHIKAYNKAEIHINLIFVNKNTTASLVSLHQEDQTFILPNSLSLARNSRLTRDFLAQFL